MCGEAEISQLDTHTTIVCMLAEEVLRLEVPVHDAELVHVVDGKAELPDNVGCLILREMAQ